MPELRGRLAALFTNDVRAEKAAFSSLWAHYATTGIIITERDRMRAYTVRHTTWKNGSRKRALLYSGTEENAQKFAQLAQSFFGAWVQSDEVPTLEDYLLACAGAVKSLPTFCAYINAIGAYPPWDAQDRAPMHASFLYLLGGFLKDPKHAKFACEDGHLRDGFIEAFVAHNNLVHGRDKKKPSFNKWVKDELARQKKLAKELVLAQEAAARKELAARARPLPVAGGDSPVALPGRATAPDDGATQPPAAPSAAMLALIGQLDAATLTSDAVSSAAPASTAAPSPTPAPTPADEPRTEMPPPPSPTMGTDSPLPLTEAAPPTPKELPLPPVTPARGESTPPEVVVAISSKAAARGPRSPPRPQRVAARPAPPLGNARETTAHVAADVEPSRAAEARHDQAVAKKLEDLEQYYLLLEERAESQVAAAREECFERIREVEAAADARVREIEDATDARIRDALRAAAAADREALRASGAADRADERSRAQETAITELTARLCQMEKRVKELTDRAGGDRTALGDAN